MYGDNVLTLNPGDRVKISDGIRAGDVYQYLGPTYTVPFDFLSTAATSTVTKGKRVKVVGDRRGLRVPRLDRRWST